ncbi:MAG: hypothetical protein QOI74_1291 [Micromonosporaceae bacterium]|nr:hypothetical protein [Micromonosporaceae bacterium]
MDTQPGPGLLVIERILRDRDSIWRQIITERDLPQLTGRMLASSAVSLALYGAVLGANFGWLQALSSAVKLPLLFLATLAICLPTLYLFNLVFGARLSVQQAVTLIMVAITVISVLTLAFAPISLFFLITAHSYAFFKLLNVAILMLTALVGLRFLTTGMRTLNEHAEHEAAEARAWAATASAVAVAAETTEPDLVLATAAPAPTAGPPPVTAPIQFQPGQLYPALAHAGQLPAGQLHPGQQPAGQLQPGQQPNGRPAQPAAASGQRPTSMALLYIWILLFGFVGTQLGWTLRPFFGSPGERFELFRNLDGTFYGDILSTIGRLISG